MVVCQNCKPVRNRSSTKNRFGAQNLTIEISCIDLHKSVSQNSSSKLDGLSQKYVWCVNKD